MIIVMFMDNGHTVSVMPKGSFNQPEILQKCQKMACPDYIITHTGNSDIQVYFGIVRLIMLQQVDT